MRVIAKKRLGQNFLADKNMQGKIIASFGAKEKDRVLEIGPGEGALTGGLLEKRLNVTAIELDNRLFKLLADKFSGYPNLTLLNQDILKTDIRPLAAGQKIKVIGNIPYYITTPIIEHLFNSREVISDVYLTVQKEFAQRVTASSGTKKFGALSCFVQYYSEPKILFFIKKDCFCPIPKVDSAFLHLKILDKPKVEVADEALFFKLVRTCFQQRRKVLSNTLKSLIPKEDISYFCRENALKPNVRAEELSLDIFAKLANHKFFQKKG
ncbi:MAG: 16S rRNA (adenine(1518)-N(6)/adenine(1519)-N(6))-dimethyltransferase RsmA [Candidatus Omnitrophica bacterium]|jgi:16S rRNA (adenine1518-N6/adenine1519-N6)-dimethyltransferase|nr:16S rRNA (adenine(1518)-N(6)/adenine(1519)-N(6))-dimethyltransferase RsmA [Candidatus Omnitrophota bacterium]